MNHHAHQFILCSPVHFFKLYAQAVRMSSMGASRGPLPPSFRPLGGARLYIYRLTQSLRSSATHTILCARFVHGSRYLFVHACSKVQQTVSLPIVQQSCIPLSSAQQFRSLRERCSWFHARGHGPGPVSDKQASVPQRPMSGVVSFSSFFRYFFLFLIRFYFNLKLSCICFTKKSYH